MSPCLIATVQSRRDLFRAATGVTETYLAYPQPIIHHLDRGRGPIFVPVAILHEATRTGMKWVLTDDRILLTPRSGVRVYLEQVVAHWPDCRSVELVGMLSQVVARRRAMPCRQFRFPELDAMEPMRLQPLSAILKRRQGLRERAVRRLRPMLYAADGLLARAVGRSSRYSGFFEPNHIAPANRHPTVTTIHDLSVLEMPQLHPAARVAHWRRRLEQTVRWTAHWVCVSQATAAALNRALGISIDRITIIPLASRWSGPPAGWTPPRIRRALGLPDRYIVCVSTIEPRKNILRLLDAYGRLDAGRRRRVRLVLAGAVGWGNDDFWESLRVHPMAESVLATGYLSDGQTAAVMVAARAMVYPSLYEGFGLPPLEAMSLGVPTAVSTAPSLVEVCGDAALRVDAEDTEAWTETMLLLSEGDDQRNDLIERGRKRAAAYSWRATAQRHHDVLDRVTG